MTHRVHRLLPVLLFVLAAPSVQAADPSALWHIVDGRCLPDQMQHNDPAPCTAVDLAGGYAVLKDIVGNTQFLLIPTARVSGIDDKAILAADAPNYWADAWQARRYVNQRVGRDLPRDNFALAINSAYGRSQDQLHIHIDCVRSEVRAALAQHQAAIGAGWTPFPVPLAGHRYRALRLNQAELGGTNPFRLLAASVSPGDMGQHTLVLAGATFGSQPGFILLDDQANLATGDRASGEELEDHNCAVAQ